MRHDTKKIVSEPRTVPRCFSLPAVPLIRPLACRASGGGGAVAKKRNASFHETETSRGLPLGGSCPKKERAARQEERTKGMFSCTTPPKERWTIENHRQVGNSPFSAERPAGCDQDPMVLS
ncbi:unnamed protein product [Ascophyllum nodosum]